MFSSAIVSATDAITPASFSPGHYAHRVPEDVAVLSVSGWMDGAGYQNGAIARFLTLPNRKKHLLLGPWDHGARINVSPWRHAETPQFSLDGELLRFFDQYLMGAKPPSREERFGAYFSLHDEAWHAAPQWPPIETKHRLHLGDRALSSRAGSGEDRHQVDFGFGTGTNTRYERLAAHDAGVVLRRRQPREAALLAYRSDPLPEAANLAGHAVAALTPSPPRSQTLPSTSTCPKKHPTARSATSPRACSASCTASSLPVPPTTAQAGPTAPTTAPTPHP